MINIEVAFATSDKQIIISITVDESISIIDAINKSGIAKHFPEYDLENIDINKPIGIFGKKVDINTYKLQNKDRIEIYRPLTKTPNQKRLERVK